MSCKIIDPFVDDDVPAKIFAALVVNDMTPGVNLITSAPLDPMIIGMFVDVNKNAAPPPTY